MAKLIYLVIDGAADRIIDRPTSLEISKTPGLDNLAKKAIGGMVHTVGPGIAPESDCAVLSLLGYDPEIHYTGRGPLEALGAGIRIKEHYEIAFRANFATIDPTTKKIIDRRVGRSLSSVEAKELANALNNMDLGIYEGYARVIATIGHRAVVVIGSRKYRLSDAVENTDPAYRRRGKISEAVKKYSSYIQEPRPLDSRPESKITSELVKEFIRKSIEILEKHPINKERERKGMLKANALLLRDGGCTLPAVEPISRVFGRSFAAIVEMPVELGIARLLGMDTAKVPPPTGNPIYDYELRLRMTLELLKKYDVVYVHLKGPDEPAHDGNLLGKVRAIENIDHYYVEPLLDEVDMTNTAILVTADHATPPKVKAHTDDPVPFILSWNLVRCDGIKRFTEAECNEKGSLGTLSHGYELLPLILKIV